MNRGLLFFSILVVLAGIGSKSIFVAFFGVFLAVVSLIPSRRFTSKLPPVGTRVGPRTVQRATPPTSQTSTEPDPAAALLAAVSASSASKSNPTYTPALFPGPIFPSLSLQGQPTQNPPAKTSAQPAEKDEVLEVGAILALARVLLG
ncbi:MAG: hypothetical protein HY247_04540 [archaeon]|nr:MAG: hypothetical protein HY247_04540 [archaeon]